ncbi:collectin-12-like protein [Dinothrombium tinctorium]|uniref:Collectin-12-like protein n=1 Tax=Dinothrombium tinctorium TaxID=1965070 RepID=A0A443QAB0_9ACAR|nr:collectin-12-like protein [Dinothrombium tinctorium]
MNFTLKIIIFVLIFKTSVDSYCATDWIFFNNKCFISNKTAVRARENYQWCQSINASMVKIESENENNFMTILARGTHESGGFWLGAIHLLNRSKEYVWTDGSDVVYTKWAKAQPNDEDNFCVAVVINNGFWWDRSCEERQKQLCQKQAEIFHLKQSNFSTKINSEKWNNKDSLNRSLNSLTLIKYQKLDKKVDSLNYLKQTIYHHNVKYQRVDVSDK